MVAWAASTKYSEVRELSAASCQSWLNIAHTVTTR